MNEKEVKKIIQEELFRNANSGSPIVPRHNHDARNSPQVNQSNIIPLIAGNGTITMSSSDTYILNLGNYGVTPRSVTFYGGALNTTGTPLHAMIVGSAQLGNNQQFQPFNTRQVILGPVQSKIIQGSAALISSNAGTSILKNSQGHIVFAADASNNNYATATITDYSDSKITIVTSLAANWSISGLWIVQ